MQECLRLGPQEELDLVGVNRRQDGPTTEGVRIVAQMTGAFLSLALRSSAMGTIFQSKLNGIWNCEIESATAQNTERTSEATLAQGKIEHDFESAALRETCGSIDRHPDVKDPSITQKCPIESTSFHHNESINEGQPRMADHNLGATSSFLISPEGYMMDGALKPDPESESEVFQSDGSVSENEMEESFVGMDMDIKDVFVQPEPSTSSPTVETRSMDRGNGPSRKTRIHKHDKPHTCPMCGRGYTNPKKLTYHIRMKHRDTKPFVCPTCCEGHQSACKLRIHMRTHQEKKKFLCDTCGKNFLSKGGYKQHIKGHSGEKPFHCTYCGQSFARKGYWQEHVRIHTGEKRFTCTTCGSAFIRSTHLQRHIRTHTGERPYKCELCDKSFATPSYLTVHMTIHTGLKNYVCSTCGKGFNSSTPLKRHIRIHTGEKPYACSVCDKRFNQTSSRHLHMRIHTGEKPYVCSICGDQYSQKGSLHTHMKMHATEDNVNPIHD